MFKGDKCKLYYVIKVNGVRDLQTKTNNKYYLIFTFLVITMPIVNSYASPLPSIGLSEFLILIFMPILLINLFKSQQKIKIHGYWLYFYYCVLISLLILLGYPSFSAIDVGERLLRDAFYTCIIFILAQNFFNIDYGYKLYRFLTIIACVFLLLQFIAFYLFNYTLPWIIPGLELNYSNIDTDTYVQSYTSLYSTYYRPTSFFLEPSYFSQFVTPFLILLLFQSNKKVDYKLAIFISIAMLLSTSANAYIFLVVVWISWFIYRSLSVGNIKNIIGLIFTLLILVLVIMILFKYSSIFNSVLDRFTTIGDGTSNSANVRLLRGIYFFGAIDPIFKLVGIGFGTFQDFSLLFSVSGMYDFTSEYMNSFSYLLISSGVVGISVFLYVIFLLYRKVNIPAKVLIIFMMTTFLSSSIYSSPIYVILFAFILNMTRKGKQI
jgi:hypothetical protein